MSEASGLVKVEFENKYQPEIKVGDVLIAKEGFWQVRPGAEYKVVEISEYGIVRYAGKTGSGDGYGDQIARMYDVYRAEA